MQYWWLNCGGKFIQKQHLKIENSKSSNARNVMNCAWTHDL